MRENRRRVTLTWCIRGQGIFVYGRKCGVVKEDRRRKQPWIWNSKFGGKRERERETMMMMMLEIVNWEYDRAVRYKRGKRGVYVWECGGPKFENWWKRACFFGSKNWFCDLRWREESFQILFLIKIFFQLSGSLFLFFHG